MGSVWVIVLMDKIENVPYFEGACFKLSEHRMGFVNFGRCRRINLKRWRRLFEIGCLCRQIF